MRKSLVSFAVAALAVLGAGAPAAASSPATPSSGPSVVAPVTGVVLASPCCKQAIR
ncbi:hypothetical protein [Cellulomonas oligotrophica]|uniref:Chaplin domain-containing protein n=1 Tax=Cellulomonas oligotrophica TaxID=931536 RepID=A0A7Y9FHL3_9CELL|nr:hypothetical protein [Cellulomonas oligotrophica]NYD87328.1 hypothetical protein [Cellulomonas oligotrophica]GIG34247.1 hypothetical protein Col01nite_34060 [Cellulomonas oligotrophica]